MPQPDIDLKAEVARVQAELTFFREECLPAFLGGPVQDFLSAGMSEHLKNHIVATAGRLSEWREAAIRLAGYLPLGPLPPDDPPLARTDFASFLFQQATPGFEFRDRRIVWRIGLFTDADLALLWYRRALGQPDDEAVTWDDVLARLPEVERWLMGLPVEESLLWNSLCLVLPALADADPSFVKLALDPETWRDLVLADRGVDEQRRARRLAIIDGILGHVLNNALLHALGTLAGNHFLLIRDYLDHLHLRGSYTHLMSHYLFAVLFEKIQVLRQLSREWPGLWAVR